MVVAHGDWKVCLSKQALFYSMFLQGSPLHFSLGEPFCFKLYRIGKNFFKIANLPARFSHYLFYIDRKQQVVIANRLLVPHNELY